MSEVRLIVRDADRDIHGNRHGSFADAVIAALAAEPETIDELDVAVERFIAAGEWSNFRGFSTGIDDQPYDAGLVVVDLVARLVVRDSTYPSTSHEGEIAYHDGRSATRLVLKYHLSDDWEFMTSSLDWQARADALRRSRPAERIDVRAVVYGKPLMEFIARECFAARAVEGEEYDAMRQIHARWMMDPRGELLCQSPREVLLARRTLIDHDLQDRKDQWSHQGFCPRGVDPDTAAFRLGGFGTHELVTYYELVRALIADCRAAVAMHTLESAQAAAVPCDFPGSEVDRLLLRRDEWLDGPDPELDGRTPRSIIDNERGRIPEDEGSGDHERGCDCPLCELMEADLSGPMFWCLDGSNMDQDFAFSFHRSREDYDAEQLEFEEMDRHFDALAADGEPGDPADAVGLDDWPDRDGDEDDAEDADFGFGPDSGTPAFLHLFEVGAKLAELITELKRPAEDRAHIDALNRDFGNLRVVLGSLDDPTAEALVEPVIDHFCETIESTARAHPELERPCAGLRTRLRKCREI